MRHVLTRALVALCLATVLACSSTPPKTDTEITEPAVAAGEPLSTTTTLGPMTATVTVTPKEPVIGDIMALSLRVDAEKGVEVEMPVFQEAFTRFSIEGYADERETTDTGERHTQSYRMQASSSGRLRIPPLRIVFHDRRSDQSEESDEDRELLTEELALKIAPVLAGEEASTATLRPVRQSLEEDIGPGFMQRYWWAFAAGTSVLLLGMGLFFIRRKRVVEQISPYERASVALAELEARGLPEEEALDEWYVQLSRIVRRYLEDRFALRAPELTTEEFLRVAQRSVLLRDEHKALLIGFLADCDRVKFAGYEPGDDESRSVLEAARRFLLETREELGVGASRDAVDTKATDEALEEEEAA